MRAVGRADGGNRLFVLVDLCIGDTRVVIDDGMHERRAQPRVSAGGPLPGAVRGEPRVAFPGLPPEEPVSTAVGDVAEFGDVHVDHGPG